MTQKLKGAKLPAEALSAEQVIEFLRKNPDFFNDHPDAVKAIPAPSRALGDGVVDLQQAMIDNLRGQIDTLHGDRHDLLSTTRANMQTQNRIHECVISLLGATSFEQLIQTVTTDFAVILSYNFV